MACQVLATERRGLQHRLFDHKTSMGGAAAAKAARRHNGTPLHAPFALLELRRRITTQKIAAHSESHPQTNSSSPHLRRKPNEARTTLVAYLLGQCGQCCANGARINGLSCHEYAPGPPRWTTNTNCIATLTCLVLLRKPSITLRYRQQENAPAYPAT